MPSISIIVPVYKVEKYLHSCLDSILAQTFADIEVILVDDGSPDTSGAICDEYAQRDDRVRVYHKKNGGVSAARNFGLDVATGTWIMFVDSDDKVMPQLCQRMLEHAEDKCLPMCSAYAWEDDKLWPRYPELNGQTRFPLEEFDKLGGRVNVPWGKLFSREIIEQNNIRFDEAVSCGEDAIFNYHYLQSMDSVFVIDEMLYHYRIVQGSLSHGEYIKNYEECVRKMYDARMALAKARGIAEDEAFHAQHYARYFLDLIYVLENTFHKDSSESWMDKMRKNNAILKSEEFALAYPYRMQGPKAFSKKYLATMALSYRTGNYFWLWLLTELWRIKFALKRR